MPGFHLIHYTKRTLFLSFLFNSQNICYISCLYGLLISALAILFLVKFGPFETSVFTALSWPCQHANDQIYILFSSSSTCTNMIFEHVYKQDLFFYYTCTQTHFLGIFQGCTTKKPTLACIYFQWYKLNKMIQPNKGNACIV